VNERKLTLVGEQKKEEGRNRVEAHNEEWLDWIRYHAKELARWTGTVTIDDLRKIADNFDRQPTHPNAWGCVFRNKRVWERIEYRPSKRPDAHHRPIGVWRLKEQDQ
jgi:hypothetical protein